MKNKILLLIAILGIYSCQLNDEPVILEEAVSSSIFPIVYVDLDERENLRGSFFIDEVVTMVGGNLNVLIGSCDLSVENLNDFTTIKTLEDPNFWSPLQPDNSPFNTGQLYGDFSSNFFTKSITGLFNVDEIPDYGLLPILQPSTTINPVTGNPYYQSRINDFYHQYVFEDEQFDLYGSPFYTYFEDATITASEANEIRDKIACRLIESAILDIDITAFIIDIGVAYNDDHTLCLPCNNKNRINVYVKWGYHY
ncbi:MAG: hypothetical protein PSN34_00910 [Urechidicola sp.]|nr:hypothetical protein [Urechidicola sp.]